MTEVGSLLHFARHRGEYLTRAEAADRIGKTRKTIERYVGDGLPVYRIGGREFVHVDELLAKYRDKHLRQKATRATPQ